MCELPVGSVDDLHREFVPDERRPAAAVVDDLRGQHHAVGDGDDPAGRLIRGDHVAVDLPERRDQKVHGDNVVLRALDLGSIADCVRTFDHDLLDEDEPSLSAVPVDDVLREEIDIVRSTFEYRSDTVTISGDQTLPDDIDVQATSLLSSVFSNLLNNAVFHSDKTEVKIDVSVEQLATTITVRIADNGPGISDSGKRNVFGRGEKGLESPGSGLGLYLVDNLVTTYGGSVWIEDNEPEGTVFCVELQRA